MNRRFDMFRVTAMCLALTAAAASGTARAQDDRAKTKKPAKPESFAVVEVGEQLRIATKSELKSIKTGLDTEHKQAVAAWTEAKKAAAKAKEKFDDPKPKKPKMKVLASNLKTEDAAREKLAELQAKRDKASEKSDKSDKSDKAEKAEKPKKKRGDSAKSDAGKSGRA